MTDILNKYYVSKTENCLIFTTGYTPSRKHLKVKVWCMTKLGRHICRDTTVAYGEYIPKFSEQFPSLHTNPNLTETDFGLLDSLAENTIQRTVKNNYNNEPTIRINRFDVVLNEENSTSFAEVFKKLNYVYNSYVYKPVANKI